MRERPPLAADPPSTHTHTVPKERAGQRAAALLLLPDPVKNKLRAQGIGGCMPFTIGARKGGELHSSSHGLPTFVGGGRCHQQLDPCPTGYTTLS
jgi:hypothetical protein